MANKGWKRLLGWELGGVPGLLMGSMKKGGKVKKTGLYKLHRGETVVPAHKSHKTLDR